jgi:hypothetical protein
MQVSYIEFQQNLSKALLYTRRIPFMALCRLALVQASVAENENCLTIIGGNLLYRILTKSIKQLMG